MKTNLEKISTKKENLIYEQPSLTKYVTMKSITQNGGFSGSTGLSGGGASGGGLDASVFPDPIKMDDNNDALT